MFANTTVHELFPTPLWVVDLQPEAADALNRQILDAVSVLAAQRPAIPAAATWQTDPYIHTLPEFAELAAVIRAGAKGVFEFLEIDRPTFEITGCWVNINPKGGLNTRHTHPNNFLSGTYYVQVPPGANRIVFEDPRPQAMTMLPRVRKPTRFVANEQSVEVRPGRMVLFPAWLTHGVPANPGETERISVSFNVMFADFVETMSRPLWRGTVGPRILALLAALAGLWPSPY
jgi:uncharacterized protein (TIGR02466 family)